MGVLADDGDGVVHLGRGQRGGRTALRLPCAVLQGAGVHGEQRDAVREDVVHLTGDARPLATACVDEPQLVLTTFLLGALPQAQDQLAPCPDGDAPGEDHHPDERAEDQRPPVVGAALGDPQVQEGDGDLQEVHRDRHRPRPVDGEGEQQDDGRGTRAQGEGRQHERDEAQGEREPASPPEREGQQHPEDGVEDAVDERELPGAVEAEADVPGAGRRGLSHRDEHDEAERDEEGDAVDRPVAGGPAGDAPRCAVLRGSGEEPGQRPARVDHRAVRDSHATTLRRAGSRPRRPTDRSSLLPRRPGLDRSTESHPAAARSRSRRTVVQFRAVPSTPRVRRSSAGVRRVVPAPSG